MNSEGKIPEMVFSAPPWQASCGCAGTEICVDFFFFFLQCFGVLGQVTPVKETLNINKVNWVTCVQCVHAYTCEYQLEHGHRSNNPAEVQTDRWGIHNFDHGAIVGSLKGLLGFLKKLFACFLILASAIPEVYREWWEKETSVL